MSSETDRGGIAMWRGTGNGGTDLTSEHGPGSVGVSPWQSSEVVSRAAAREMSGGGGGGARLEGRKRGGETGGVGVEEELQGQHLSE